MFSWINGPSSTTFEPKSPTAAAASRFLEKEGLQHDPVFIQTLETALSERIASAAQMVELEPPSVDGGGLIGPPGVLFRVPLTMNGAEVEMEVMKGQVPLTAAEAFCRRSEYGFRGAKLLSCIEQTERWAHRTLNQNE